MDDADFAALAVKNRIFIYFEGLATFLPHLRGIFAVFGGGRMDRLPNDH